MIHLVPTDAIDAVWPEVEELLRPAWELSGGRHTGESTKAELKNGNMQLFVAVDPEPVSAAVTCISLYPASKWLTIVQCGGDRMDSWIEEGRTVLEAWAKHNECVGIEVFGRVGWCRAFGLQKTGTLMERRI